MRRTLYTLGAAALLAGAAALMPAPATAMTVGTAAAMNAAAAEASLMDQVAYVCRHRYYSSRRVCWWRPGPWRHRYWRSRRWGW
jgi:uncharacterized membrane-anchored protein